MQLYLFGTSGCHLCEQAEDMMSAYTHNNSIDVTAIDIAEQTHWQDTYALRIPVLYHPESQQELCWPFEKADVNNFITGLIHG